MMPFGQKSCFCRKDKKLSQAELGKLSGINGNIIGKYARDEMKPSIETTKNWVMPFLSHWITLWVTVI